MSGHIVTGSPWGRNALAHMDPETRARIEAAIPDGHTISIGFGRNPIDATLILRDGYREVRRVVTRSIEAGCGRLLATEVVIEDHGAYVVTAEVSR